MSGLLLCMHAPRDLHRAFFVVSILQFKNLETKITIIREQKLKNLGNKIIKI
jgi:hypothetical protein